MQNDIYYYYYYYQFCQKTRVAQKASGYNCKYLLPKTNCRLIAMSNAMHLQFTLYSHKYLAKDMTHSSLQA